MNEKMMAPQTPTIQEIEEHPIVGNHYSDMGLFSKIHLFVCDEDKPMDERIRALRVMDKAMGIVSDHITETDVNEYVKYGEVA